MRERVDLTIGEKIEIKNFVAENTYKPEDEKRTYDQIAAYFTNKFGKRVKKDSIWRINKTDLE